jgi:hypothetical protein
MREKAEGSKEGAIMSYAVNDHFQPPILGVTKYE